jgi:hypothetical protein
VGVSLKCIRLYEGCQWQDSLMDATITGKRCNATIGLDNLQRGGCRLGGVTALRLPR